MIWCGFRGLRKEQPPRHRRLKIWAIGFEVILIRCNPCGAHPLIPGSCSAGCRTAAAIGRTGLPEAQGVAVDLTGDYEETAACSA